MPESADDPRTTPQGLSEELELRIRSLVSSLVGQDEEGYEAEFVHLLDRVGELVDRKVRMEGTKTETRDFLGELLFTKLRRGMHQFLRSEEEVTSARAAEWVMGVLFSISTLSEFAKAFDRALIRASARSDGQDFSFAGRTDFISVEEVLQMLAAGKHLGCLSLEKGDNRLDVFLKDGRVFFLDPHHLTRRVLPGDAMHHKEIAATAVTEAEARRASSGVPVLMTLAENGVFGDLPVVEVLKLFGKEVLFDFMREQEPYAFYYRTLDELPEFALDNDLRLGVTSLLLEGSKLVDDWKQMLTIFPNPDAPLEPTADMFARMGDVALSVLEIKLLSQINGDTTPRSLTTTLGLPLYDVYELLIRLGREGILSADGDIDALQGIEIGGSSSVDESMREAFAALDANDDEGERQSAIDRVFGGGEGGGDGLSALDQVLGDGTDGKSGGGNDLNSELLDYLRKKK